MNRLPPKHFLLVFWGLGLAALAPGFFLTPDSPAPWLRALNVWFNAWMMLTGLWQIFWFWRAFRFATNHPAMPQGAPNRVRTVQRLAALAVPVYLVVVVLSLFPRSWRAAHALPFEVGRLLTFLAVATALTMFTIVGVIARAIRDAEIAANSPIRRSAFSTFLQLVYLPFAAPFLRHRLEVIAGEPSELVAQPAAT